MEHRDVMEYFTEQAAGVSLWINHCGWENCIPGHSFGPAVRDHYLIHFIVRGTGRYKNRSGEYTLGEGQGFLISPGESTLYTASEEDPWEYFWVGFRGVEAVHILELCGLDEDHPVFTCEHPEQIRVCFERMLETYHSTGIRAYAMLAQLYLMLTELMQQNVAKSIPSTSTQTYLDRALQYISDNYSYDVSVQGMADYAGVDRTYLYRIFEDTLRISPMQYLTQVRMTRATELLKNPAFSILQVALSTGYKDLSHFSNAFKKYYGQAPSFYRKEHLM